MMSTFESHRRAPLRAVVPALAIAIASMASTGCASFKLKHAPPGFIEVSSSQYQNEAELRMKAPDNVGINVTTESNYRGGTLALWADDMLRKLGERGYVLLRQDAVKSRNGVAGTRFDFRYNPPGGDGNERFYTAVLFVTDQWRVIAQVAGKVELEAAHQADLEQIIGEIKIRGCKVGSKVCKAGQPQRFETTQATRPNTDGSDADTPDADADADAKPGSDTKPNGDAPEADAPEADAPAGDAPDGDGNEPP